MSTRSLLFLVPISLIFMSGRGLEAISSNVDISATERPISVKFILMTSVEGYLRNRASDFGQICFDDIGRRWGTCVGGTFEHLIKYS